VVHVFAVHLSQLLTTPASGGPAHAVEQIFHGHITRSVIHVVRCSLRPSSDGASGPQHKDLLFQMPTPCRKKETDEKYSYWIFRQMSLPAVPQHQTIHAKGQP
jgi:hypothetical protein